MKDIKGLMAQWSEEVMQEELFAQLRSPDWPEFVRTSNGAWKGIHDNFVKAIFEKHEQFRERFLKHQEEERNISSCEELRM